MGKKLGIIVALCAALVFSLTLAGCAGGVDKSNFTGDWKFVSSSDDNLDAHSVELMKSLGLEATLTLADDGTGSLDMFGDVDDVTWDASSNADGKLSYGGGETAMKLANGELTLADVDGETLTFTR